MKPEILAHPNIPKPLHGLAPRTIFGATWWKNERADAIAKQESRCASCGVHLQDAEFHHWLEAHEYYDIDFATGKAVYKEAVALCHSCHQFIHSGRLLAVLEKGEISFDRVHRIVDKGLDLCFAFDVIPYVGLQPLVEYLGIPWQSFWQPDFYAPWSEWRLVVDGKEYKGFDTIEDWAEKYNAEITEEDRLLWSVW
jgi:hypothetical protein